jgi:hypothetical protein
MALGLRATLILVGTRANSGGTLGEEGVVVRYLLARRARAAALGDRLGLRAPVRTSLLFVAASDDALRLVAYDGTGLQLSLPPRGPRREAALAALAELEGKLSRASWATRPRQRGPGPRGRRIPRPGAGWWKAQGRQGRRRLA